MSAYEELKNKYFIDDFSVSYTLKSDDITKGEKPPMSPYTARKEYFSDGEASFTQTKLEVRRDGNGYMISAKSRSEKISQFGLNLPFNFMGKKNGGGWKRQYLFNSPYSSSDNKRIFCYFTSPCGENLLLLFLSPADGWKMDYSPFSGGQYFDNLQALARFDKAYNSGEESNKKPYIKLFICSVKNYEEALETVSEKLALPVAVYEKSYCETGKKLKIKVIGEFDYVKAGGKIFEKSGDGAVIKAEKEGLVTVTPYKGNKKGLDCQIYVYKSINELFYKSMRTVSEADLATGDGNLCEWKCYVSAILRYQKLFGKSAALQKKINDALKLATERDESKALPRQTIFYKKQHGFPAYHDYASARVQEQFFAVGIFFDVYALTNNKKYLNYAIKTLDCLLDFHQKGNGGIFTRFEGRSSDCDYTTVCCPMINVVDAAVALKEIASEKSKKYALAAKKMAEYVYLRGENFPTETDEQNSAEPFVEEGSISCSALTLLYYCAKIERVEKYIEKAKEFLNLHDNWVIKTHIAPMYYSTLRWWETKWEGDKDGNALCCGHAWTIWRAEADYWYYKVSGDKNYLEKARAGFMSNISKINKKGKTYACYQPDYITGGGFAERADDVEFRIARGFPRQTDSGLSRYLWTRAAASILTEKQPF